VPSDLLFTSETVDTPNMTASCAVVSKELESLGGVAVAFELIILNSINGLNDQL